MELKENPAPNKRSRRGLLKGAMAAGALLAQANRAPAQQTGTMAGRKYRAFLRRAGGTVSAIEDVNMTPLDPFRVVVRTEASQCCYTIVDQALRTTPYTPAAARSLPGAAIVLGHGGVGVVEAIGSQVRRVQVGDRVIVANTPYCGQCYMCLRGRADRCQMLPVNGNQQAAVGKLNFTTDLADLADRQLVIEAILEDESVKAGIFAELDRVITDPDAVLASNTSSIPIMKLAAATANPGRVLGLHFFNPVPVLPLVELVSTLVTDDAAAARTEEFASAVLRKQVVRCSDRSGFVVNALLVPYLLSAIRMVEAGFATVEDVDKAVVAGLSHPMGPLRLSDLVGLDTLKLIADKMYQEFKDPQYGAPPLLLRMVEAGLLGKKSGKGFYSY